MAGGYDTPEDGFLWKPVADNGGLVILLPSKYRGSNVKLIGPDGNVIEEGRSSGYANGNREHFRFGQDGGNYPDGTIVEVTTSDGSTMRYQIGSTSSRVEAGGVTSDGSSLAGADSSYLMSNTNLNIQKPHVADKFAAANQQASFKSPLSTLETIRTVSDIIRGSTKSYNSIMKVAASEEIAAETPLGEGQPGEELTPAPKPTVDVPEETSPGGWGKPSGGNSARGITEWPDFSDFIEQKISEADKKLTSPEDREVLDDLERETKPWHS